MVVVAGGPPGHSGPRGAPGRLRAGRPAAADPGPRHQGSVCSGPARRHEQLLRHRRRRGRRHDLRWRRLRRRHARGAAGQADRRRRGRPHGRLLAGRLRRRHLLVRQRAVLRLDRRHRAQQADRRHGGHAGRRAATGWSPPTAASSPSAMRSSSARPAASRSTNPSSAWRPRRRQRLLARGLRRRHLLLRRCTVPGLDRRHPPERARRGHGGDSGRRRLLDGGLRRRHLHLRGCAILGLERRHPPERTHRGHDADARRGRLLAGRAGRRCLHLRRRHVLGERAVAPPSPALPQTPVESGPSRGDDHQRGDRSPGHPSGHATGGLLRRLPLPLRGGVRGADRPAL